MLSHSVKRLIQVFGLGFALALFAPSSKADTTYSYVGNPFNQFAPTESCPPHCRITGSFTASTPLLPSSSYFISPLSFSFTDGSVTFTQDNVTSSAFGFITDAQGLITGWNLNWFNANNVAMFSGTGTSVICPVGCSNTDVILTLGSFVAGEQNDPGTWTMTTTGVPEPSSLSLLCFGMLGLVALSLKKAIA
jgi:hypothetical protein